MEFNRMEGGISDAIEISVKWSNLEDVYHSIEDYFTSQKIQLASHVSHVYHDGASIYYIFYINEKDEKTAVKTFFHLWREVLKIAMKNGASISHHHGIGIIKNEELKTELGYGYDVLQDLKKAVDPNHILNSGKLIRENKYE
jgi:alkyldihydroxyacetonephosphate synthase